jgi:glycosyltransferase involved in cell wall biosynthesis
MTEIEGIEPDRTLYLPNGIPSATPASARDVRPELGIEPGAPIIGSVGSLYTVKAFDVLLRATALLVGERPDVRVLIVGDGPERPALERLARELGVDSSVRLLGSRSDVPDILDTLDIAVCCSNSEGSPLSVMEYMGAGLPVVASAVGGLPDLIEPGVNGLLVPPGDPSALAEALADLLGDPERAQAMGARGRERQRAEFDIDVLVRRLENLYCDLLDGRAASCAE